MTRIRELGCCVIFLLTITVADGCGLSMYRNALEDNDDEFLLGAPAGKRRYEREVTLNERSHCGPDDEQPLIRVNTTQRVNELRQLMLQLGLHAYIIPTEDEHQSEYVAPADERRRYITGFSGSAGIAVVTGTDQALWTDGRYFLQADDQLDCHWLLMKHKNEGVPKMTEWIKQKLQSHARVGADPRLIGAETWKTFAKELEEASIEIVPEENNLVDRVWPTEEKPGHVLDKIFIHELKFAGLTWEEKVALIRKEMEKGGADLLVLTALDEIAWLLNLRGSDIPYNPVFRSYLIVGTNTLELYLPNGKITPAVDHHLRVGQCDDNECVTVNQYGSILDRLRALKVRNGVQKVMIGKKYSYSGGASYAIYSAVPEEKRVMVVSPVLLMKSKKNDVEIEGMKNAHIKDAVALCDFLSFLEKEIKDGKYWSEISAAEGVTSFRSEQEDYMGISFATISAYGPNGAIVHYQPQPETNKQIENRSLYLLDSGGQYKDGTTDVTRTMHYGDPTPYEIETYTRVLQGAIDLAKLVFPEGTGDTDVDIVARKYLYDVGLDYRHGTGHGIGMFLNVHEAPLQVRVYGKEEHKFELGQFFSDEPGYYKDNEFGIRLETILRVVEKDTKYHFDTKPSYGFDAITLVPFESNLINITMLDSSQCKWLNEYHAKVRNIIGPKLQEQGRERGFDWLLKKTEPILCVEDLLMELPDPAGPQASKSSETADSMGGEVTLEQRSYCQPGDTEPEIRVNTSYQVERLRQQLDLYELDAYIIPSGDEHQSEYVGKPDKRRHYMTGFTGSAGLAVITKEQQALWTDGRYFLQGDLELDCNWLLMKKTDYNDVPTMTEWLKQNLGNGSRVGADPRLVGAQTWLKYERELVENGISLVDEEVNLVDIVWPAEERPSYPNDPVFIHELQFAGKKWESKVAEVREEMEKQGADMLVLSQLDEIAWLLNLRGSDIPYNPVFRSYVFIGRADIELFIPKGKITPAVDNHLNVNQCGEQECVIISEYTNVLNRLRALQLDHGISKVMLASNYSYSGGASYALYSAVPEEKRMFTISPVLKMKARKNNEEIQGMKNAHIKDAVAVCEFLAFMEKQVNSGVILTELEAQARLEEYRSQQKYFMGPSFGTISAFGSNGAVIHYKSRPETNKDITKQSLYLVDSGGQYKDGTTDITRTLHYGDPEPFQIEAYTRVLMGAIDLAMTVFPKGVKDSNVDIMARKPLYNVGLDYRHGTGHGIGMFLNIHEAPTQVRIYAKNGHEFEEGQFFSDEPGYYQDNHWGIRLETILMVVPKTTKYMFDKKTLGFEAVTLVPFEPKLIDLKLLSDRQCTWLNNYHSYVRRMVGPRLQKQGSDEAYEWMTQKTAPLNCYGSGGNLFMKEKPIQRETVLGNERSSNEYSTHIPDKQDTPSKTIEYTTSAITTNADFDQQGNGASCSLISSLMVVILSILNSIKNLC